MSATIAEARPDSPSSPARRTGLAARLFEPVPIGPLVQFRIALGLILLWEAYRYVSSGWPRSLYLDPPILFKFYGFEWVRPLPEPLHLAVFPLLGLLAVCVAVGFCYRVAAALSFLGWAYVFLLDQVLYLNHLYLVTLVVGLAATLPANRAFSIDALLSPKIVTESVPRWTLAVLRAEMGFVYFFGGVAKLNPDWFSGVPMQMMLVEFAANREPIAVVDRLAGDPNVALFFAWSGMLFDLLIVPLLWWPRTRLIALLLVAGFHLTNHTIFKIGIFPWFALATTLILWPPFPLSLLSFGRIYGTLVAIGMVLTVVAGRPVPLWAWLVAPVAGVLLALPWGEVLRPDALRPPTPHGPPADGIPPRVRPVVLGLLAAFFAWQLFLPFRHLLYPGDVSWTEEGHKWAWHMKLRIKHPEFGLTPRFLVVDGDGRPVEIVDPPPSDGVTLAEAVASSDAEAVGRYEAKLAEGYSGKVKGPVRVRVFPRSPTFFVLDGDGRLATIIDPFAPGSPLSFRQARTMATRPELILQFAHHLRDEFAGRVKGPVQVTANVRVSLNGREPQPLIVPDANLAAVEPALWPPADWITTLEKPRPPLGRVDIAAIRAQRTPRPEPRDAAEEL